MEIFSHKNFIAPNDSAADCYLRQWYVQGGVWVVKYMCVTVCDEYDV